MPSPGLSIFLAEASIAQGLLPKLLRFLKRFYPDDIAKHLSESEAKQNGKAPGSQFARPERGLGEPCDTCPLAFRSRELVPMLRPSESHAARAAERGDGC